MIPLEGRTRIPQRFAIDWLKLGEDGKPFKGEAGKNENWYGYGAELLAVADGTVVGVKDGIPENVPLAPTRVVPITLETVGGNYVILDLGNGRFAFYAHLQPQSVRVKVGDKVRKGQVLGLLGNSGNSDAPHLHFHLGDANSPLGTEGLPCVFEAYELLGQTTVDELIGKGWKPQAPTTPSKRQQESPLEDQVIRFR
jgi:murein DD-endopeptidase MepM/ murein hydrolase activator NlpD